MFLLYLRPIINGAGNYFIEAKTRSLRRMDLLVIYAGALFIIEMKIWRGDGYNEAGEKQITDYMNELHLDKGYMLTFSFLKDKEVEIKTITVDGKTIIEATV